MQGFLFPTLKGALSNRLKAHLKANLKGGLQIFSVLGALALAAPSAVAQTNPTDQSYLNDLYGFLESQDTITYMMATQELTPEQNVWAAQMFCQAFSNGASPAEVYSVFTSAALGEVNNQGAAVTDEVAYAVGLYGGSVMNLGAAHYCPQFQTEVEQALNAL